MNTLDSLLNIKYSKEELNLLINQFSIGQRIFLTDLYIHWLRAHTVEFHGGHYLKNTSENNKNSLQIDQHIINGGEYSIEILKVIKDTGDNTPGAQVLISTPKGLKHTVLGVLTFY